jgi:hypothetical protein
VTAAEALPRPLAVTCVTFVDPASRTVSVRPGDQANGYTQRLWREAWSRQRRSQEAGWPASGAPWLFADVPGRARVTHGVPSEGGVMAFHWPVGSPGFAELVSRPGLLAVVTVDLSSGQFLTCRLFHRSGPRDAMGVGR